MTFRQQFKEKNEFQNFSLEKGLTGENYFFMLVYGVKRAALYGVSSKLRVFPSALD